MIKTPTKLHAFTADCSTEIGRVFDNILLHFVKASKGYNPDKA